MKQNKLPIWKATSREKNTGRIAFEFLSGVKAIELKFQVALSQIK